MQAPSTSQGEDEPDEPMPYVWHATAFLLLQQQAIELAEESPSAFAA